MVKQTAVEWLLQVLEPNIMWTEKAEKLVQQAKEMENERAHEYAEFAIRCDRMGMKILNFDGFINLK
jgi:tRNA(Ser,Leu) C12 N-acetylase TAN1